MMSRHLDFCLDESLSILYILWSAVFGQTLDYASASQSILTELKYTARISFKDIKDIKRNMVVHLHVKRCVSEVPWQKKKKKKKKKKIDRISVFTSKGTGLKKN